MTQLAPEPDDPIAGRIHRWIGTVLALILAVELLLVLRDGQWFNGFLILLLLTLITYPVVLAKRVPVKIPSEFQILAVLFTFAALFLGEVRGYYLRVWWWDLALHGSSGLLLGMLGFLLVYVLNASRRIQVHMQPGFIALFAFLFAVAVGALWEIFEFAMDQLLGTNMQKPMLGDPSGLTDTMWDLILDSLGALLISVFGWWYMKRGAPSFIERWIRRFIVANPRLFRR